MNDDGLDIPAFCIISPADRKQAWEQYDREQLEKKTKAPTPADRPGS